MDAGLFGVVTPRMFGGSELGFATLVDVTAEIASACGSTGWVYGVLAGHSWMLNLFPLQAQREVMSADRVLTATVFRLGGTVTEVEGGYRLVNGDGRFCSGIDHVQWVIVAMRCSARASRPSRASSWCPARISRSSTTGSRPACAAPAAARSASPIRSSRRIARCPSRT